MSCTLGRAAFSGVTLRSWTYAIRCHSPSDLPSVSGPGFYSRAVLGTCSPASQVIAQSGFRSACYCRAQGFPQCIKALASRGGHGSMGGALQGVTVWGDFAV